MAKVLQRPRAIEDLISIWTYIARDSPGAADRVINELERITQLAAEFPLMGRARPELHSGLRSFVSGNYLIYWVPIVGGVEVFRYIHGARLISAAEFD